MTPAEHAKAIERAVEIYARDFAVYSSTQALTDFRACSVSLASMQAAIRAGVGAGHLPDAGNMVTAPDGWQLVPVEPTNAMLDALEEGGCSEGNYKAALAAAPKP